MELQEFSDQFDVLYNSITSNQAPGLDEYEKSVFLTKALEEILLSYFDPRSNKTLEGFDGSQRRQIDFSMVTMVERKDDSFFDDAVFDTHSNSRNTYMPDNVLLLLNERVTVTRDEHDIDLTVVPITFTEYDRLMSKPYKRPLKNQAWRLLGNEGGMSADIIVGPNDTIKEYRVRYIIRPMPIILSKLGDGMTINNSPGPSGCILDPILHHEILQRAVELAKASYGSNAQAGDATLSNMISLGQASQTGIGLIQQSR